MAVKPNMQKALLPNASAECIEHRVRASAKRLDSRHPRRDRGVYFRDIADLVTVSTDPDFIALQAIEAPYISKEGVVAQLGWVETYIADQQVVNLVDGKSQYQSYEEASSIELTL